LKCCVGFVLFWQRTLLVLKCYTKFWFCVLSNHCQTQYCATVIRLCTWPWSPKNLISIICLPFCQFYKTVVLRLSEHGDVIIDLCNIVPPKFMPFMLVVHQSKCISAIKPMLFYYRQVCRHVMLTKRWKQLPTHFKSKCEKVVGTPFPRAPAPLQPCTQGRTQGRGVGVKTPHWAWYFTKTLLPSQGD